MPTAAVTDIQPVIEFWTKRKGRATDRVRSALDRALPKAFVQRAGQPLAGKHVREHDRWRVELGSRTSSKPVALAAIAGWVVKHDKTIKAARRGGVECRPYLECYVRAFLFNLAIDPKTAAVLGKAGVTLIISWCATSDEE